VKLQPDPSAGRRHLFWRTLEDGQMVDLQKEPARSAWQKFMVKFLSLLPLDSEL
jgi:hypothetical protein